MAWMKKMDNSKCQCGYDGTGTLMYCWWEREKEQLLWKPVWNSLQQLNTELPYNQHLYS